MYIFRFNLISLQYFMNVKKPIKNLIQPKSKCVFEQKKETILKNKLEFLKIQLSDTHKRVTSLKQANRQMRITLADYNDQKQNNSNNIGEIDSYRYRCAQDQYDKQSQQYQRNEAFILSMKEMMEKKLKMVEKQHKEEEIMDNRKVQQLQNLIAQYKHLCEDAVHKKSRKGHSEKPFHEKNNESPYEGMNKSFKKTSNTINISNVINVSKQKLFDYSVVTYRDKQSDRKIHLKENPLNVLKNKSISLLNSSSINDVNVRLPNNRKSYGNYQSNCIKPSLSIGRLNSTRFDVNLNETLNSNTQLNESMNTNDKRLIGNKSFTKIITRIKCEECQVAYGPNQYYRHIEKCNKQITNIRERNKLLIKLKDTLGNDQ